jgi:hypothetical protein
MQPDPIRVIAFSSLILGSFFMMKSISVMTPKYVLHELLNFKVNKSRFFRKYISQRLESVIGFMFLFVGFVLQLYLEVQALGDEGRRSGSGFDNWWLVITITVVAMLGIAFVLSRVTRFFSNQVFVEQVRFMVETHGFPLESDEGLVLELGRVMRVRHDDDDTVESYSTKVRAKMRLPPAPAARGARVPPRR